MKGSVTKRLWRRATVLATLSLLCAALLGGLSAWFLVSVALAGGTAAALAFNIHVPGALVRLFAIGRTVTKYGERLIGHQAALHDQVAHRATLFRTMAGSPDILRSGWQIARGDRLADFLDDVEDVDFGRLRTHLPITASAFGLAIGALAALWVAPLSFPLVMLMSSALTLCAKAFDRQATDMILATRNAQRLGEAQLGAALASVVPLKAEHALEGVLTSAMQEIDCAETIAAKLQTRQSALENLAAAFGPLAALTITMTAWYGGARDDALTPAIFVGFAWLALGEAISGVARIVTARVRQQIAAAQLASMARPTAGVVHPDAPASIAELNTLNMLNIEDWPRIAPTGRVIGAPVSLTLRSGHPTALVGVSGSGKTSLLKQIAGWTGNNEARVGANTFDPLQRRAISLFCLHDAAILADTVRANLFAPDRTDADIWGAIDLVEMRPRIELAGGLDGWIEQATLSLGEAQRLNLARAALSPKPLILLDEPTEHLDPQQGRIILRRLLHRLQNRIVVISTHRDLNDSDDLPEPGLAIQILRLS